MVKHNSVLEMNASLTVEGVFEDFINNLDIPTTPGEDSVSDEDYKELQWNLDKHLHEVFTNQIQNEFPCILPKERSNLVLDAATYCFTGEKRYAEGKRIGQLQIPVLFNIMWNCDLFVKWHDAVIGITRAYLEISYEESMADKLNKIPDIFQVKHQLQLDDEIQENDSDIARSSSRPHDAMADIQADLQKPDYVNWLVGSLMLKYLCEPTREYERCVFEKFQSGLYNSGTHFNDGENIKRISNSVHLKSNKWVYPELTTHCNECDTLFNEIIAHYQKKEQSIGFRNCKMNAVAGAWGIAKLFMPNMHWAVMGPDDTDTQALFHIILNCDLFKSCDYKVVDTIISMRNKLMHSPNLTMTDDNLTVLYDSALDFLKNVQQHGKQIDVTSAKDKIEQLKHGEQMRFEQAEQAIAFQLEDKIKGTFEDTDQNTMRLTRDKLQKFKIYNEQRRQDEIIKERTALNGARTAMKKVNDDVRELRQKKSELKAELKMLESERVKLREL